MPIFPRDFLAATEGLSAVDGWAYIRLILHAWLEHGYLPYDPAELARLGKVTPLEWVATWRRLASFWDVEDGRISQGRLLYERERAIQLRQARSRAGKKGGESPRVARGGVAKAKQREANGKPPPSPSPAEEIPPTPRKRGASPRPPTADFRTWLAAYPVQVDELGAWRAWQDVEAELPPLADMLTTLAWQRRLDFDRRPPDRVPYPKKYLRSRRWTDKEPRTGPADRLAASTPPRTPGWICPYHRQVPDRPASEQDPDCSACKRLGPRPKRRGSGEATPAADVIRASWSTQDKEVQR